MPAGSPTGRQGGSTARMPASTRPHRCVAFSVMCARARDSTNPETGRTVTATSDRGLVEKVTMTSPRSRAQVAGLQNLEVTWKGDSLPASPHWRQGTAVTSCDKLTSAFSTPEGGSGRGAAQAEGTEARHAPHLHTHPGSRGCRSPQPAWPWGLGERPHLTCGGSCMALSQEALCLRRAECPQNSGAKSPLGGGELQAQAQGPAPAPQEKGLPGCTESTAKRAPARAGLADQTCQD